MSVTTFIPTMQVQEAAVIGIPHPKWTERPLLIVVRSKGSKVSKEEVLQFLQVGLRSLTQGSLHGYASMLPDQNACLQCK